MRLNGRNSMTFVDMLVIASIIKWDQDHPHLPIENLRLVDLVNQTIDEHHLEGWRATPLGNDDQLRKSLRKLRILGFVYPPRYHKQNILVHPSAYTFADQLRRRFSSVPWNWPYAIRLVITGANAPKLDWEDAEPFPSSPIDLETQYVPTDRRPQSDPQSA